MKKALVESMIFFIKKFHEISIDGYRHEDLSDQFLVLCEKLELVDTLIDACALKTFESVILDTGEQLYWEFTEHQ